MRQFSSLVTELSARGHEVHVAFQPTKGELEGSAKQPGVTHGFAPARPESDGWRSVAWLVRGLEDLARYTHPRYERAPELRERMTTNIGGQLRKSGEFEPVVRRLALRLVRRLSAGPDAKLSERVIHRAARLEQAIPTSPEIDAYIRGRAPDVVLATPVVNRASTQVEFLKSARRLGIGRHARRELGQPETRACWGKPERALVPNPARCARRSSCCAPLRCRYPALARSMVRRRPGPSAEFVRPRLPIRPARSRRARTRRHRHRGSGFVTVDQCLLCGDERLRRMGRAPPQRPRPLARSTSPSTTSPSG
jgi:hypothetical protein